MIYDIHIYKYIYIYITCEIKTICTVSFKRSWRCWQVVTLLINALKTETCCDFVLLYDGFDTSANQLAILSGSVYSPYGYTTTQSYMYIRFTSDTSVTSTGFSAIYTMTAATGKL